MKYIKYVIISIISLFIVSATVLYLSISEEEKIYVCTGEEVNFHPYSPQSVPFSETKKTIAFRYLISKSLIGSNEVVETDYAWIIGHRDSASKSIGRDGIVSITDGTVGAWSNGYPDISINFNRITKQLEVRVSVPDKKRPGYLTFDKTFNGTCLPTNRG